MSQGIEVEKGRISVNTQNILPIIKKWLYSEKEIFVRELISNGFDAITKLRKIALSEEIFQSDMTDYAVNISIDREHKTLTIEDNGVGMTADEIKTYITQIAFSGAEEFARRYQENEGDQSSIIGHFGLGFFSSFMVASRVEIQTRSYRPDAVSAYWTGDGGEEYEMGPGSRENRGTSIILHVDEAELLDLAHVSALVRRYCDFIPIPVRVDGAQVNRQEPLWARQPSALKKEDYIEFYKYLYPHQPEPLFYVHLNVDHPFRLQGILYFPKLAHELDLNRTNVKVFCKQVFVSDEAQELIPKYLTVLQGMIDLPDLPLNVSRSYLQNEPQIKKIASHIVKKTADRLTEEFRKSRQDFEKIWSDIAPFVKFSAMSDERFFDQVKEALLFKVAGESEKKFVTLDEYVTENTARTSGKIYYASDVRGQAGPLSLLRAQNIEVLLLDTLIDTHFIQFLESKETGRQFVRIDAELAEHVLEGSSSKIVGADNKNQDEQLTALFKGAIKDDKVQIRVEALKSEEVPAMILLPEHVRRFSEMTAHMSEKRPDFPKEHTLLVNSRHPVIRKLAAPQLIVGGQGGGKSELAALQIYRLARLMQGGMSSAEVDGFVADTYRLLDTML